MKFSQLAIMLAIAVSQARSVPVSAADLAYLPSTKVCSLNQRIIISLDPLHLQVADPSDAQLKRNSIDGHYGEGGYYGDVVQTPDVKRDSSLSEDQLKRNSIDGNYGEGGFYGYDVQTPDVKRDDDVFDEGVNIKIVPRADEQA